MSRTIDIRQESQETIVSVVFADEFSDIHSMYRQADKLEKHGGAVRITESGNGDYVRVWTKKDAENLKAALDKAIALGWLV